MAAVRAVRDAGLTKLDAYAPFAIDGLPDALGLPRTPVRPIMLAAGVIGTLAGFGVQLWSSLSLYPTNEGGRPHASLPSFMPITFECAIGFAALAGFAAFLVGARLTRLHDPIFATPGFERASDDGFFLAIAETDPHFAAQDVRALLQRLGAQDIADVTP